MRQQMSEKLQKRGGQSLHDPNRNETRAPAPAGRHDRSGESGPPSWPRGAPDRSMVPSKVNASSLRASHAVHAGSGPRCDPIVLGPRPQWEMTPRAKLRFASLLACHGKRSLACEAICRGSPRDS
ncbi:hypothetical protein BJX65DRAFT_254453 [Aspergillus insuetus]